MTDLRYDIFVPLYPPPPSHPHVTVGGFSVSVHRGSLTPKLGLLQSRRRCPELPPWV